MVRLLLYCSYVSLGFINDVILDKGAFAARVL